MIQRFLPLLASPAQCSRDGSADARFGGRFRNHLNKVKYQLKITKFT